MDLRLNFKNIMVFKLQSTVTDSVLASKGKITFEDHNKLKLALCYGANFCVTAICLEQVFLTGHSGREHCCH